MEILLTGANGFIGKHLSRLLSSRGIKIHAPSFHLDQIGEYKKLIDENDLDAVIHLAGISSVAECEANISNAFQSNVEGTYQLASMIASRNPKTHFIFPSTGQVYAANFKAGEDYVYSEGDRVTPRNLYALTKYLGEEELRVLSETKGLSVTALRIFNHAHKSQRPDFFLASVYQQLLLLQQSGKAEGAVQVGNVDLYRDFGALQDLLDAFVKVLSKGPLHPGKIEIFNLSSGRGKNLRGLVEDLARKMNLKVVFEHRPELTRSNEPPSVVASSEKFNKVYDWQPQHSLTEQQLVDAFLTDL